MSDAYMTPDEAARHLGVHVATLGHWRSKKKGPVYYKLSGLIRYRMEDLKVYEEASRVVPGESNEG